MRYDEGFFEGAGGTQLLRRMWLPARAHTTLVVTHGMAEHTGRYRHFASWFVEHGFAVHLSDLRGHGRSHGPRMYVESFDEYLDDLQRFVELVRTEHAKLPLVLLGHSMGGLITASFVCTRQPAARAVVLSAAAFDLSRSMPAPLFALARVGVRVLPRLTTPSTIRPSQLSRDPDVVRRYAEDPMVHKGLTVALASELGARARRTVEQGAMVRVPLLALHGSADQVCLPQGTERFYTQISSPGSGIKTYPGLHHEIFNEPERQQVYQDILDWLEQLPPFEARPEPRVA